jgi:hypothetical protein
MQPAKILICAAAILLSSCTPPTKYAEVHPGQTPEPPVQRERQAYLKQSAQEPVTCSMGADCNEKWARALQWVNMHSQYSVKTSTDSEIMTYGPIEPTTDAAFTITKTPQDSNTSNISFSSTCGMAGGKPAPCVPTSLELNSEFKDYLLTGTFQGDY